MSQAYMFRHNIDPAKSMHTPLSRSDYIAYFNVFTDLHFQNEYTHMRNCVCLDTRLVTVILPHESYLQFSEIMKTRLTALNIKLQYTTLRNALFITICDVFRFYLYLGAA